MRFCAQVYRVVRLQMTANSLVAGLGIDEDAPLEVNGSLADQVNAFEKNAIAAALVAQQGSLKATNEALCLSRKTLYEKMHKYGLRRAYVLGGRHSWHAGWLYVDGGNLRRRQGKKSSSE